MTEPEVTDAQRERDELIAAMRGMTVAPEPGANIGEVIQHGGDDTAPMIVSSVTGAGWCYIWDTRTHERSITNLNMLSVQLKKRREDGSFAFTATKPDAEPERGTFKCPLHKDMRKPEYDLWKLPVCRKQSLASPIDVKNHMKHRHKTAWEAIEEHRLEEEKKEDKRRHEELLLAVAGKASKNKSE